MAKCRFCGRPSGIFKKLHDECQERHQRAIAAIPGFFVRVLESQISAVHFSDLLQEAAEVSFIKTDELLELCLEGISRSISAVLEQRLLNEAEQQRIGEIFDSLNATPLESAGLNTLLVKMEILRDLSRGIVPDKVTVVGPMPLVLRKTEAVLWIFNQATALPGERRRVEQSDFPPPLSKDYYAQGAFTTRSSPGQAEAVVGDLVLTNYNVYFLKPSGQQTRIPISRIAGLRAHLDGVEIGYSEQLRVNAYLVPDPWFLANALAFLSRRFRGLDELNLFTNPLAD